MIAMGVGDQQMADRLATHRIKHRVNVFGDVQARVNDGDLAGANDRSSGAVKGIKGFGLCATTRRSHGSGVCSMA